jgi:hypothetical protein
MQVILVQRSPRLAGEKVWKSKMCLSGIKQFKESSEYAKYDDRSGCPVSYRTDKNADKVQNLVQSYKRSSINHTYYEGVSKSFRTGRLERELQMVQLSATKCSCIAIL